MNRRTLNLVTFITMVALLFLCLTACEKAPSRQNVNSTASDTTASTSDNYSDTTATDDFNLTEYDTPPTPVQNPMPVYPVKLRKSGIQGSVVLNVMITPDGTVGDVSVLTSLMSGAGGLDEIAASAVKGWIFKPALKNNKPVQAEIRVPIVFSLKPNN